MGRIRYLTVLAALPFGLACITVRHLFLVVAFGIAATVCAQKPERVQVAVFLAYDCPISQKYIPAINKLYKEYRATPGFEWFFVVPGKRDRRAYESFVKEYAVQFPLTHDPKLRLVRSFGATVTPEVVIRKQNIVYRGAIDNWFYELGKYRHNVTEQYLADALLAVVHGNLPAITETKAIGCPIAFTYKKQHH